MTRSQCPDCDSENLDESFDDLNGVCNECGYVLRDDVETDEILTNQIDRNGEESEDQDQRSDWSDVYSVSNGTEKQVATALEVLEDIANTLAFSTNTRESAARIYGQAAMEQVTDGRPTPIIVGAALYIGSREQGEPRPLTKVADTVDVGESRIDKTARMLQRNLGIEQPICDAEEYLPHLRDEMGVEQEIEERARGVLSEMEGSEAYGGKSPAGLAGAALYWAADGQIPQREVAQLSGVTTETIRVRLTDLREVTS